MKSIKIHIKGLVQGVGFRPFVYRIAQKGGVLGTVENRNDGVHIIVTGKANVLNNFLDVLKEEAPPASRVDEINSEEIELLSFPDFSIKESENVSDAVTGVSPDISVCKECLEDMHLQDHRIKYPLINCTNCGPRFSIIKELPYDRPLTTMSDFVMCDTCAGEYKDVIDRRFHAQPVACNKCGPRYSLIGEEDFDIIQIVDRINEVIKSGGIIALKGTGGYHLLCDPFNQSAVAGLRTKKGREGKPFAIMCRDIEIVHYLAETNNEEENLLLSWQRPIVLLKSKSKVADSVSNGLNTVGVVLPYMPIHYMLLDHLESGTILFTSANISDEPVIIDDKRAVSELVDIADIIVSYDREIHNRVDDSVAIIMAGKQIILRRSRGYTPSPVRTNLSAEGIFAAGAELVNSFCIGKGSEAIMSQYIGDLKNDATLDFYKESFLRFSKLFRFKPNYVVCDLHPDYLSTRFAETIAEDHSIEILRVQHHHAHIASCMAENQIGDKVIGLSLDGVGLGSDGHIWGGEVMIADLEEFERVYHFDYVPIVGSDKVSSEPWRSGLAYLLKYYPDRSVIEDLARSMNIDSAKTGLFASGIKNNINSHYYSSAGRLFDAVASLCGVNTVSDFHAEAPMRLESILDKSERAYYDYVLESGIISYGPTIEQIVEDLLNGVVPSIISTRFHNTVVNSLLEVVAEISQETGLRSVVLSGGTFQNRYLSDSLFKNLNKYNYKVYLQGAVPQNDGGIALGQLAIAAKKRS